MALAARRALLPGAARAPDEHDCGRAHAAAARPRPDRALQGVPPAQAQDAGVRLARGRPLPHAADPHARGHQHRAHGRAGAAAQRGPRRGDRPRPRPRPPAVRPHRRGGARRVPARALRPRVPPLRALAARRRGARAAQPQRRRARRDPLPLGPRAAAARRSRARSCGSSIAWPTSTTTSTTRCAPGCSTRHACPPTRSRCWGRPGSRRIDTLVHDMVEASAAAGAIVQGEEAGAAMDALRTFMFDEVYLGPVARAEHAKINTVIAALFDHYADDAGAAARRRAAPPGADLAQRVSDYIAGMTDRYCLRAYEDADRARARSRSSRSRVERACRATPTSPRNASATRSTWSTSWARAWSCASRAARRSAGCARSTRSARRRSRSTRPRRSTTASAARRAATASRSS